MHVQIARGTLHVDSLVDIFFRKMSRKEDPRQVVEDVLLRGRNLDREGFVDQVWGAYQRAVDRRDADWIYAFQRDCVQLALSEEEVHRYLPNPYGGNYRSRRRPRSSGESRTDSSDYRLRVNPDLPIVRTDAAERRQSCTATATSSDAADRRQSRTATATSSSVITPEPYQFPFLMPFPSSVPPCFMVPQMMPAPSPGWPSGLWNPAIRPVTIGSPSQRRSMGSGQSTVNIQSGPLRTNSSVYPQREPEDQDTAREIYQDAGVYQTRPERVKNKERRTHSRSDQDAGVYQTRPERVENRNKRRTHSRPDQDAGVYQTRPERVEDRELRRTQSRSDHRTHPGKVDKAATRRESFEDAGVHRTRVRSDSRQRRGFIHKTRHESPDEDDVGVHETRIFHRSRGQGLGRSTEKSGRDSFRKQHESSQRPDRSRRAQEDLRDKLDRKKSAEVTNQDGRPKSSDNPPPAKKRKTGIKCPIRGCQMDVGTRLQRHLESHHLPGLFHQGMTELELSNRQFQSLRRHALEMFAQFLFGRNSRVEQLVEFVNDRMPRQDLDPSVSEEYGQAMDALALVSNWNRPTQWTINPVNSPAALIHWRPLAFLMSQLELRDRREMFLLFGERWTVPEKVEKRRRVRLNPSRRRNKTNSPAHQDSNQGEEPRGFQRTSQALGAVQLERTPQDHHNLESTRSPMDTGSPSRDPETQSDPPSAGSKVSLRDYGEEVVISALGAFSTEGELTLTLEPPSSPELDYGASPQKALSPISTRDETILCGSPQLPPRPSPKVHTPDLDLSAQASGEDRTSRRDPAGTCEALGGNVSVKSTSSKPVGKRTFAEVTASKKGSSIGPVRPVMRPKKPSDLKEAYDSHFHLDRLSHQLHKGSLVEETIFQHMEKSPKVPVTLCGGVMVFCDPKGYDHIPRGWDPKWKIAVGVHPKKVKDLSSGRLDQLKKLLSKSSALGEVGLDYQHNDPDRESQRAMLEKLLPLCQAKHVLVLHVRGSPDDRCSTAAFAECLAIVKKHVGPQQRIHLHCFTGDRQQVSAWTRTFTRCYFGFTGKATHFSLEQRTALREVPWNQLLMETDSPYLAVNQDLDPVA